MKVLAAAISSIKSNNTVKAVFVKKVKDKLTFISASKMPVHDLMSKKGADIKLTFDYSDFFTAEADLPPLNDRKSIDHLIKNKVKDMMSAGKEYTFVSHEAVVSSTTDSPGQIPDTSTTPKKKFTIFGLPADFYQRFGVTSAYNTKVSVLTLDQFALTQISERIDPVGFVCHVFADNEKVIVSFSMGREQVYARTTYIPEGESDLVNFYYETINLTYLYIKQNRQVDINTIILSGDLVNHKELAASVEKFTTLPVVYPTAERFIKGCDNKTFHDYLLAIGTALANDYVSFSSVADKEQRVYASLVGKLTAVMFIAVIGTGAYTYTRYAVYSDLMNEINRKATALKRDLDALKNTTDNKALLMYKDKYIRLLAKREDTPANLLYAAQETVKKEQYEQINFVKDKVNLLQLKKEREFSTYVGTYIFDKAYQEYLSSINQLDANKRMVLNLQSKKYDMSADLLEQEKSNEKK